MKYIIKVIHRLGVFTSMPLGETEALMLMDLVRIGEPATLPLYKNQRAFLSARIIEQSVVIVEELAKGE